MIRHALHREAAEDVGGSLAVLATAAPSAPPPTTSSSRSAWPTVWRRSTPRSGTLWIAWNGRGVSEVEQAADGAESRPRHAARTGRRHVARSTRCPTAPRRRDRPAARGRAAGPDPARPPRPHRVRGRGLDEGPRDPARRGPALRLDRRRDRPAEGGARRRDGPRPQPGAAHRPVPPRRAHRRHDRPVQPRRAAQQADDPRGGGPRSRRPRGRRAARRAPVRLDDDADRVLADLPPRAPGAGPLPGVVPVAPRGAARRATGRARSAARSRSRPPPSGRPPATPSRNLAYRTSASRVCAATLATSPSPEPVPAMTRPHASPLADLGRLIVLYVVWGSTYLGMKVAIDTHAAVRHGRVPVHPRGRPARALRRRLEPRPDPPARAARGARRGDRRDAAARRRDRPRRVGRADDPHRDRGRCSSPSCRCGSRSSAGSVPRAGAAARRPRASPSASSASRSSPGPPATSAASTRAGSPRSSCRPICWTLGHALRRPARGAAGAGPARERRRDVRRRARVRRRRGADRRVGGVRPRRRLHDELGRASRTSIVMGSLVGYTTFAWLIQRRAAVARVAPTRTSTRSSR